MATKELIQILEDVDSGKMTLEEAVKDTSVKILLEFSFDPAKKLLLPEGMPPHNASLRPVGLSEANIRQIVRKLDIYLRKEVSQVKREQLFISALEAVHPSEATLLVHIKDQALTEMYPNITKEAVSAIGIGV